MQKRFLDRGIHRSLFNSNLLVRCPGCDKEAKIVDGTFLCAHCDFKPSPKFDLHKFACTCCNRSLPQFKGDVKYLECEGCGRKNYKFDFLGCSESGVTLKKEPFHVDTESGRDEYYGVDLLLKTSYKGKTLWFYNLDHLNYLESFLQADLRERTKEAGGSSLIERLPSWIKQGKSREGLLKKIAQIKKQYLAIDG